MVLFVCNLLKTGALCPRIAHSPIKNSSLKITCHGVRPIAIFIRLAIAPITEILGFAVSLVAKKSGTVFFIFAGTEKE